MRLIAFCEAPGDFQIAADLIDRAIREHGPPWVTELMEIEPRGVRTWEGDDRGHEFWDLHELRRYSDALLPRPPHGHFRGQPGAAGAAMARTIFHLVRKLNQRRDAEPIAGVVILWDMDHQGEERRRGLRQARDELAWPFIIVLGCPDLESEAWVLAGFEPDDAAERTRLDDLRKQLGFAPNESAHRLRDAHDHEPRSPKRVLMALTAGDPDREQRCWRHAPLAALRSRGEHTGLRGFLEEVTTRLVPRLSLPAPSSRR